ncbi:MAG TPA: response regulator transcription factor [Steroidobacteraceae bacterium]|nr:response regulator transcription factor [Steroidobacteraceae bacterium]
MRIRVALAEDQDLVREALGALLERSDFEVVLSAADGVELLERIETTPADVIVSDIRMPGLDGICMVRELRERGNRTPVVMLTTFEESELLLAAVEAGAQAFLLKGASPADLITAIERARRGEQWLSPVVTKSIYPRLSATMQAEIGQIGLGARELEILRLMAGGYSNKEIARTLYLAEGTVKNYASDILAKLGTRDRTRAVLKAITLRLV